MAFLRKGHTPGVKPGWLRAYYETDMLTLPLYLWTGQ